MKKKLDRKNYMFDKQVNQVLIKVPGQIDGKDFVVQNCEGCEIYVCDHTAQVFVDDSKNCRIFFGPVEGSLFVRDCSDIEINCASGQFRVSGSTNIKAYVYTQSDPALENAVNIQLAPYNFTYPGIDAHFAASKLRLDQNKWSEVFDFTPNLVKRNWSIIPPSEFPSPIIKEIEGFPTPPANPVLIPIAYGGTDNQTVRVGSVDARSQEQGGEAIDFSKLMGKEVVQQLMEQQAEVADCQTMYSEFVEQETVQQPINTKSVVYDDDWFGVANEPITQSLNNEQQWQNPQQYQYQQEPQYQQQYEQAPQYQQEYQTQYYQEQQQITPQYQQEQQSTRRKNEDKEFNEKKKKQQQAQDWLKNWKTEYDSNLNGRKKINRQQQQVIEESHKREQRENPWSLICQNINLKDLQQTQLKSVDKMRNALLNKRKDTL